MDKKLVASKLLKMVAILFYCWILFGEVFQSLDSGQGFGVSGVLLIVLMLVAIYRTL